MVVHCNCTFQWKACVHVKSTEEHVSYLYLSACLARKNTRLHSLHAITSYVMCMFIATNALLIRFFSTLCIELCTWLLKESWIELHLIHYQCESPGISTGFFLLNHANVVIANSRCCYCLKQNYQLPICLLPGLGLGLEKTPGQFVWNLVL